MSAGASAQRPCDPEGIQGEGTEVRGVEARSSQQLVLALHPKGAQDTPTRTQLETGSPTSLEGTARLGPAHICQ